MFYQPAASTLTSHRLLRSSYPAIMDRTPIVSTTLASSGYDANTCLLELEFRSGAIYQYLSVPASLYRDLLAADSKGRFFNRFIRHCFPTYLIAPAVPAKTI